LGFGETVTLAIRDNGSGFVVPDRPGILAQGGHYGLMGMVERVEQMHGQFRIQSSPGEGTVIEIGLPLPSAAVKA
jgi:signal transduction histidine kinase